MRPWRSALYTRVPAKQPNPCLETELVRLRQFARRQSLEIVGEYADRASGGPGEWRPQLKRLMADARRKQFDVVLVERLNLFAHSTNHLITALAQFQSLSIQFVSVSESIDTSTPEGRLFVRNVHVVAEMERSLRREQIQLGVDRVRREGKKLGRPVSPVDEITIARRIAAGESISKVARDTRIARATVRRVLGSQMAKKPNFAPGKSLPNPGL